MGEFNSDNHYIYYCGQESLRRNGMDGSWSYYANCDKLDKEKTAWNHLEVEPKKLNSQKQKVEEWLPGAGVGVDR